MEKPSKMPRARERRICEAMPRNSGPRKCASRAAVSRRAAANVVQSECCASKRSVVSQVSTRRWSLAAENIRSSNRSCPQSHTTRPKPPTSNTRSHTRAEVWLGSLTGRSHSNRKRSTPTAAALSASNVLCVSIQTQVSPCAVALASKCKANAVRPLDLAPVISTMERLGSPPCRAASRDAMPVGIRRDERSANRAGIPCKRRRSSASGRDTPQ